MQERIDAIKKTAPGSGGNHQFLASHKIEFKPIKRSISQRLTPTRENMRMPQESQIADLDERSFLYIKKCAKNERLRLRQELSQLVQTMRDNAHARQQHLRRPLPPVHETDLDSIDAPDADDDEDAVVVPQIYPSGLLMTPQNIRWIFRKTRRTFLRC